jgi:hypothetical protein
MICSSENQKELKKKTAPAEGTLAHAFSRSRYLGSESVQHVFWLPDQPDRCAFPTG